jgi:Glycosyltransferase family 87
MPARIALRGVGSRIAIGILLLLGALALLRGLNAALAPNGSQDFQWSAARAILQDRNPYREYLEYKAGQRDKPYILTQSPNYPASAYVFLLPFGLLSWPAAKVAWAAANVLFTGAILAGLQRLVPLPDTRRLVLAGALVLAATCHRNIVGNGQHTLLALAAFTWALVWAEGGSRIAALLLAVSWFKYTVTFPLSFIFLIKRRYATLVAAAAIHLLLLLALSWWLGESAHELLRQPFAVALSVTRLGEMDVPSVLQQLGVDSSMATSVSTLLFVLCALASLVVRSQDDLLTLCVLALLSYTIVFHFAYDIMVLVFVLWYCLAYAVPATLLRLFVALIVLTWYAGSALAVAEQVLSLPPHLVAPARSVLHIVSIILLYGTLGSALHRQLAGIAPARLRPRASAAGAQAAPYP